MKIDSIKININPVCSYSDAYKQRKKIYKENLNKTGIYLRTNRISRKCYVGSSVNLSRRLRDYFNKSFLKTELRKNNSMIYRALLKYDYSNFKLDILEYCDPSILIWREQFYLDNLELKYNTLKIARSLLGFKHSIYSKERIRTAKLGKPCSETTKLKLSANSQAVPLRVENIKTGEIHLFTSIRRTACFLNMHPSYLIKSINNNKFYRGRGYFVIKESI